MSLEELDRKIDRIASAIDKLTGDMEEIGRQVSAMAEKMLAPMEDPGAAEK